MPDDTSADAAQPRHPRDVPDGDMGERTIDDGFGNVWELCDRADCDLQIVRPGKVQCRGEWEEGGCPQTSP